MNCYVIMQGTSVPHDCNYYRASVVGVYSTPQLADKAMKILKKRVKASTTASKINKLKDGFSYWYADSLFIDYYVKEMPLDNLDIKI